MKIFSKKKKLVTHDGAFHADDIFACASLQIMCEQAGYRYEVVRTRDEKIINSGDIVFDVGGVYDPAKDKFDHHQPIGAGKRPNGIEYAAFGLVWKKFGELIAGSEKGAEIIDQKIAAPIDAWDNGMDIVENKLDAAPYYIQHVFFAMSPTWKEDPEQINSIFLKCVALAKQILEREIKHVKDMLEAETEVVKAYEYALDKRIIVLDKSYPFEFILSNFPEPIFAIYPRKTGSWGAKAIRADIKTFVNRKNFPENWGGKKDQELQELTGVNDAVFCHHALFLAVADTREGAIKLAQIAVES